MNEHRRQILEMLSAGKITADEAERLIVVAFQVEQHSRLQVRFVALGIAGQNTIHNGQGRVLFAIAVELLRLFELRRHIALRRVCR